MIGSVIGYMGDGRGFRWDCEDPEAMGFFVAPSSQYDAVVVEDDTFGFCEEGLEACVAELSDGDECCFA